MISTCKHCHRPIRDCTAQTAGALVHKVVLGWYHIHDGYEQCRGRTTMAEPSPLVNVNCRFHPRRPDRDCPACATAAQVMAYFHERERCIPSRCVWVHVQ